MQYEIAHCHHATEGTVSRLWYTMSWLEEKALPRLPPCSLHRHGGRVKGRERRPWQQGTSMPPPVPGIKLRKLEPDNYSTFQDWGRLLALESQVEVHAGWPIICSHVGHFKETKGWEIKGSHWWREWERGRQYQKRPPDFLQKQHECAVSLKSEQTCCNTDPLNPEQLWL